MTRRPWNPLVAEERWKPVGKLALRRKAYGEWLFSGIDTGVQFWVYLIQTKLLKNFKFEDLNSI